MGEDRASRRFRLADEGEGVLLIAGELDFDGGGLTTISPAWISSNACTSSLAGNVFER